MLVPACRFQFQSADTLKNPAARAPAPLPCALLPRVRPLPPLAHLVRVRVRVRVTDKGIRSVVSVKG